MPWCRRWTSAWSRRRRQPGTRTRTRRRRRSESKHRISILFFKKKPAWFGSIYWEVRVKSCGSCFPNTANSWIKERLVQYPSLDPEPEIHSPGLTEHLLAGMWPWCIKPLPCWRRVVDTFPGFCFLPEVPNLKQLFSCTFSNSFLLKNIFPFPFHRIFSGECFLKDGNIFNIQKKNSATSGRLIFHFVHPYICQQKLLLSRFPEHAWKLGFTLPEGEKDPIPNWEDPEEQLRGMAEGQEEDEEDEEEGHAHAHSHSHAGHKHSTRGRKKWGICLVFPTSFRGRKFGKKGRGAKLQVNFWPLNLSPMGMTGEELNDIYWFSKKWKIIIYNFQTKKFVNFVQKLKVWQWLIIHYPLFQVSGLCSPPMVSLYHNKIRDYFARGRRKEWYWRIRLVTKKIIPYIPICSASVHSTTVRPSREKYKWRGLLSSLYMYRQMSAFPCLLFVSFCDVWETFVCRKLLLRAVLDPAHSSIMVGGTCQAWIVQGNCFWNSKKSSKLFVANFNRKKITKNTEKQFFSLWTSILLANCKEFGARNLSDFKTV